jgi:hypothetical protein
MANFLDPSGAPVNLVNSTHWPTYGTNSTMLQLNGTNTTLISDTYREAQMNLVLSNPVAFNQK